MGLIGGIARTAVAAGTWTAVSNGVNRRQQNRWAQQNQQQAYQQPAPQYYQQSAQQAYQQPAPQYYQQPAGQAYQQQPAPQYYQQPAAAPTAAAPSAGGSDPVAALKDLADLKAKGILTEEEFAAAKARIISS